MEPNSNREFDDPDANKPRDRLPIVRRLEFVCASALTLLIALLHVYRASHAGPLWRDEISSLALASMPSFSQIWSSLANDSFPLLSFGIIRMWTGVIWPGSIDAGVRVLGALIGIGGVAVLWLDSRLFRSHAPLLSLLLFGLNPTVIAWGDTARAYGLGSLLIMLVYGLVWKVLESPTPKRVAAAAMASVLSVQCLYQNGFLLLAICLGASLVCLRRGAWRRILVVFGIGAISALSLAPYLPIAVKGRDLYVILQPEYPLMHLLRVFARALNSGTGSSIWVWASCCVICIAAGGYLVIVKSKNGSEGKRSDLALFSLLVLGIGTALFFVFLKSTHLPTQPWYYIVLMSIAAVSIDTVIGLVVTTTRGRICRLAAVLLLAGIVAPITRRQVSDRLTNVDIISSMLQERASRGDFIVVDPWFFGVTFEHYYRGETAWMTVPPIRGGGFHRFDLLKEQIAMDNPLRPLFGAMQKALSSGNRVWFIGEPSFPPAEPPPLPPAPNGPDGWNSSSYLRSWTMQLGFFFRSHASGGEQVNLHMTQPVGPYENLPVWVFEGWRP